MNRDSNNFFSFNFSLVILLIQIKSKKILDLDEWLLMDLFENQNPQNEYDLDDILTNKPEINHILYNHVIIL